MNRRNFLSTMLYGLAASVAVRKFPFSVYSFPKEIKPLNVPRVPEEFWTHAEHLRDAVNYLCGAHVVQETYYIHPFQFELLKRSGYLEPVALRSYRVGVPSGRPLGSEVRYAGVRLVPHPLVPNDPYLYPDPGDTKFVRRQIVRESVPNVPHFDPLTPQSLRHHRPESSRL